MNKLALSQDKVYMHIILDSTEGKIYNRMKHVDKSMAVPCGYETEMIFEKPLTKKQKKNRRYRLKTKTLSSAGGLGDSNEKS